MMKNYDLGLENAWAERKAREPSVTKAKTRNRNIMHGSKERVCKIFLPYLLSVSYQERIKWLHLFCERFYFHKAALNDTSVTPINQSLVTH